MLKKWIDWHKKYRRVLSSEFVTLKHGTTCWGRGDINISKGGSTGRRSAPPAPPTGASDTAEIAGGSSSSGGAGVLERKERGVGVHESQAKIKVVGINSI
jgi:hypothetical protein